MKRIARWESRGGAHWVELVQDQDSGFCFYHANSGGGSLGSFGPEKLSEPRANDAGYWIPPEKRAAELATAFLQLEERIARGSFLPDAAKTPMKRVV